MNERIKELAEQATKQVTKPDGHYIVQEWQRVFAELIVRECAQQADNEMSRFYNMNEDDCASAMENYIALIKEHFGVEE